MARAQLAGRPRLARRRSPSAHVDHLHDVVAGEDGAEVVEGEDETAVEDFVRRGEPLISREAGVVGDAGDWAAEANRGEDAARFVDPREGDASPRELGLAGGAVEAWRTGTPGSLPGRRGSRLRCRRRSFDGPVSPPALPAPAARGAREVNASCAWLVVRAAGAHPMPKPGVRRAHKGRRAEASGGSAFKATGHGARVATLAAPRPNPPGGAC